MSAVYAFVVAVFIYKDMPLEGVPKETLLDSANMSAMLLYIITNAVLFSFSADAREHPASDGGVDDRSKLSVILFLLAVNILLLLAGNVMEPSSITLIMAPVLFPIAVKLGIRSDRLRHHDGGEHGGRHVPSACRSQPLRRQRHNAHGNNRAYGCGLAVVDDYAGVSRDRHVLASTVAVAATRTRDDVTP